MGDIFDGGYVEGGTIGPTGPIKYTIEYLLKNEYIKSLTDSISTNDILFVLASIVGVGMGFFLAWLGVKKATRTFTTAVSTGRIKL